MALCLIMSVRVVWLSCECGSVLCLVVGMLFLMDMSFVLYQSCRSASLCSIVAVGSMLTCLMLLILSLKLFQLGLLKLSLERVGSWIGVVDMFRCITQSWGSLCDTNVVIRVIVCEDAVKCTCSVESYV